MLSLNFWDFGDPGEAANAALKVYGTDAVTAAARCALNAHFDVRDRDYRFWFAVFLRLKADGMLLRSVAPIACSPDRI